MSLDLEHPYRQFAYRSLSLTEVFPYGSRGAMKDATFRQVKVFEAVARHLSYSRAAHELRMSQPGVSAHVKQLEAHTGVALFEHFGKKVYLTPAGQQFLRYSRAIIQELKEADEALA